MPAYKLSLKRIAVALVSALTLGLGVAHAAPSLQSCSPMEVTHNGGIGLSYTMSCTAGGWQLRYTGAVPAGSDEVNVQYQLQARGADGASFTQQRTMTLPSPAHLGQMLAREAVLLDGGDIALRECKEPHCTLYRPLGRQKGLSQATVTVPPEVQKLRLEREQLAAQLAEKASLALSQAQQLEQLTAELVHAQHAVGEAQAKLAEQSQRAAAPETTDSNDESIKALTVSFDAVMAERNQLSAALAAKQSELERANANLAEAIAEQTRLTAALEGVQARQTTTQAEQEGVHHQLRLAEANSQALEAQLSAANATIDHYRAQLSELSAADSATTVSALKEQLLTAEKQLAETLRGANEKDVELQSLKAQLSALEAERTTGGDGQGAYWKNTISSLLDDRHAARQHARQAEEAREASENRAAQLQAELDALKGRTSRN